MIKTKRRSFLFYVLSTLVGLFVFFALLFFMLSGIVVSSLGKKEVNKVESSVLEIKLNGQIKDYIPHQDLDFGELLGEEFSSPIALNDILKGIKQARNDSNIKCIYLDVNMLNAGYGTLSEIRQELLQFKETGKKIIAYADFYYNRNYFLASIADSIFLHPKGEFIFNGMSANTTFIKNFLDRLGVEMQVLRVGDFKGAVEPLVRNSLSDENKNQISKYLQSTYDYFLENIAKARNIPQGQLTNICNQMLAKTPQEAEALKLIDGLLYRDELTSCLNKLGKQKTDRYQSLKTYVNREKKKVTKEGEIAVVFAEGNIVSGKGTQENIGGKKYANMLKKIRKNKKIKALVLRVNSGGGSAFASDEILREIQLLKEQKIPIVVSFGNIAASGGYYISCFADSIFSMPNTLTGSIGVFGVYPNAQKLLNDKLGIYQEIIKTGEFSDLGRLDRSLNAAEKQWINSRLQTVYDDFVGYVAEGRKMNSQKVKTLAQGKIYSGQNAKSIGLVDKMGGLDKAIKSASEMASLKHINVSCYPKPENEFKLIMNKLGLQSWLPNNRIIEMLLSGKADFKMKNYNVHQDNLQIRIPFEIEFN